MSEAGLTETLHTQGAEIIQIVRCLFANCGGCMCLVNTLASPYLALSVLFPLVGAAASARADQLLLCLVATRLAVSLYKRVFREDRPLTDDKQSGSASSSCGCAAAALMLASTWAGEVSPSIKYLVLAVYGACLWLVLVARMYSASHYPHQCFIGAAAGLLITWAMSEQLAPSRDLTLRLQMAAVAAGISLVIMLLTGLGQCEPRKGRRGQPSRRCAAPVYSSELYRLAQTCGYLLGWALSAGPQLDKYKLDPQDFKTAAIVLGFTIFLILLVELIEQLLCPKQGCFACGVTLVVHAAQTLLVLRVMPEVMGK